MIVEIETEEDLKEIQEVLFDFYEIMPYNKLDRNTDEFQEASILWQDTWYFMIQSGKGKILAMKKNNEFIGAIGLVLNPSLEDGVLTCMEAFWYVDEKHRGQGLKLLLKAEKEARSMGAKRFMMMYLENSMPEKVKNVYERLNFRKIQTSYYKEL